MQAAEVSGFIGTMSSDTDPAANFPLGERSCLRAVYGLTAKHRSE